MTVRKQPFVSYQLVGSSDLRHWSTDGLTIVEDTETTLIVRETEASSRRMLRVQAGSAP